MGEYYIVIVGNIVDGLQFYGPFNNVDEAVRFGENTTEEWVTARLTPGF